MAAKELKVGWLGFLQAAGVVVYSSLVAIVIWQGNAIFGWEPNFLGPIAFLLLFSVSVLVCGAIVFYKPYKLFFENKKRQAAELVLATTGWLFLFFLVFILLAASRNL